MYMVDILHLGKDVNRPAPSPGSKAEYAKTYHHIHSLDCPYLTRLKFRGGRGVATFFGGLIALCPVVALFGGEVLILGVGLSRFASLGSLAGAVGTYTILVPLTILNGFPIEYLVYALIGSIAIIGMHRENIIRLITGKERKLGEAGEKVDVSSSEESMG